MIKMKFLIPAILVATVLVAGIFALMPIEQASTVHTTIQGSQMVLTPLTLASTVAADDNQVQIQCGATAAVDRDRPFTVVTMVLAITQDDAGDNIDYDALEIDGVAVTDTNVATFAANQIGTNQAVRLDVVPSDFITLAADGELDLILVKTDAGAADNISGNAMILTRSDSVCDFTTGADD